MFNKVIIVHCTFRWEQWHRRGLISELARSDANTLVLCINGLKFCETFSESNPKLIFCTDNLWICNLPIKLPYNFASKKFFGLINSIIFDLTIKKIIPPKAPIVHWFCRPEQLMVYRHVRRDLTVYDCYDDYPLLEKTPERKKEIDRIEYFMLKQANVIFACSNKVYESKKNVNPNTYLIPNGADFALFSKAAKSETALSAELANIPQPIAGFLGRIRDWIDFELLEQVISRKKEVSFVFVGPIDNAVISDLERLNNYPNVFFIGPKEYKELPGILKGFTICLIPYKINEFNQAVNPLKLHEYFAAGKPVVASAIAELIKFRQLMYLYNDLESFIDAIELAITESSSSKSEDRMNVAAEYDWGKLVQKMHSIINRGMHD